MAPREEEAQGGRRWRAARVWVREAGGEWGEIGGMWDYIRGRRR